MAGLATRSALAGGDFTTRGARGSSLDGGSELFADFCRNRAFRSATWAVSVCTAASSAAM